MKGEKIGSDTYIEIDDLGTFLYRKLCEMYPFGFAEESFDLVFSDLPKYYEGLEGVEWVCKTNYPTLNIIVHNKSGSGGIGYRNPKIDKKSIMGSPDLSVFDIKEGDFDKKPLKVTGITEKLYYKK